MNKDAEDKIKSVSRPPYAELMKQLNDEKSRSFRLSRRVAEMQQDQEGFREEIREIANTTIKIDTIRDTQLALIKESKELSSEIKKLKQQKLKLKQKIEFYDELVRRNEH